MSDAQLLHPILQLDPKFSIVLVVLKIGLDYVGSHVLRVHLDYAQVFEDAS